LETLLVLDLGEGIIWVSSIIKIWMETGVSVVDSIAFNVSIEVRISELCFDHSKLVTLKTPRDLSLDEDCETLVEPKV
jgi:hypothetical protein